ncbi:MAG: molybdopterin-dependent oxidoreductase [Candidatus Promineifilaceae bacterium]|nr:molybdopterin-dependent oxidoreductase [Candidatus Promineifilaceae bacterium]
MGTKNTLLGAVAAGLTGLPLTALLYVVAQYARLPFAPFRIFDWLARALSGDILSAGISVLVGIIEALQLGATDTAAKALEQLAGVAIYLGLLVLFGAIMAWYAHRRQVGPHFAGTMFGLIGALIVLAIEFNLGIEGDPIVAMTWLIAVHLVWGYTSADLLHRLITQQHGDPAEAGRRRFLIRLAAVSTAVTLTGWLLGRTFSIPSKEVGAGQPLGDLSRAGRDASTSPPSDPGGAAQAAATPEQAALARRLEPAPGTREELTATEDFYRIDINTRPPVLDRATWQLQIAGLFDRPRPLSLSDLMAYPAISQPITLACISNTIGGDLISTANWIGVRLRDLILDLGLQQSARALYLEAEDGFYETVTMPDMMDPRTLMVYGMNGSTLPVEHGFPLRIYIPNRYGMKQPKWIVKMTATDDQGRGYWVDRGWSREARPHIIAIIDNVAIEHRTSAGIVPIGGIAWAGDRGISLVEVQVDNGPWRTAELRHPPLSTLAWVQWRFDWQSTPGPHRIRVRATDGNGALQIEERSNPRPDGATGYHQVRVSV